MKTYTLHIETEHLFTGKISKSGMDFLCEEQANEEKKRFADRLRTMHLRGNYRLSRIYVKEKEQSIVR